jgi:hypothetical protein
MVLGTIGKRWFADSVHCRGELGDGWRHTIHWWVYAQAVVICPACLLSMRRGMWQALLHRWA